MKSKENKETLLVLTKKLHSLLDQYIDVHNLRHNELSSFKSMFRKKDYFKVNRKTQWVYLMFLEYSSLIEKLPLNFKTFNQIELQYAKALIEYFDSLYKSVAILSNITQKKQDIYLKESNIDFDESKKIENDYAKSRKELKKFDVKLNKLYKSLYKP